MGNLSKKFVLLNMTYERNIARIILYDILDAIMGRVYNCTAYMPNINPTKHENVKICYYCDGTSHDTKNYSEIKVLKN